MRVPLPRKPDWFDARLAEIYTHGGKPMFRVVDGQSETHFLNENPKDIKHWEIDPVKGRVGRRCWVIECYQTPQECNEDEWNRFRYQEMEVFGAMRIMDVKGPFPRNGRYVHFKSVRDENGNPLPLTKELIQEIKDQVEMFMTRKKTGAEEVEQYYLDQEEWIKASAQREAENFYQTHGIAALSAFHNTEVSRPIRRIWLPGDN